MYEIVPYQHWQIPGPRWKHNVHRGPRKLSLHGQAALVIRALNCTDADSGQFGRFDTPRPILSRQLPNLIHLRMRYHD